MPMSGVPQRHTIRSLERLNFFWPTCRPDWGPSWLRISLGGMESSACRFCIDVRRVDWGCDANPRGRHYRRSASQTNPVCDKSRRVGCRSISAHGTSEPGDSIFCAVPDRQLRGIPRSDGRGHHTRNCWGELVRQTIWAKSSVQFRWKRVHRFTCGLRQLPVWLSRHLRSCGAIGDSGGAIAFFH
jgi:hypothetical protein